MHETRIYIRVIPCSLVCQPVTLTAATAGSADRQWPSVLPGLWLLAHSSPVVLQPLALLIPHTSAPAAAEAELLAWQQQQDPSTGC